MRNGAEQNVWPPYLTCTCGPSRIFRGRRLFIYLYCCWNFIKSSPTYTDLSLRIQW